MVRFDGHAEVFYMAICRDCDMAIPFPADAQRQTWIRGHSQTGHRITLAVDVRPDPLDAEQRKRTLMAGLRKKYSNSLLGSVPKPCAAGDCPRLIMPGERLVNFGDGKYYHAECLGDQFYLNLARVADLAMAAPGQLHTRQFGIFNEPLGDPLHILMGRLFDNLTRSGAKMNQTVKPIIESTTGPPEKMNAKERRRLKRKDKQWQKKS